MRDAWRVTWTLTATELRRLARTSEVLVYGVLPALFGVPLVVLLSTVVVTAGDLRASVAVPLDLPAELGLADALRSVDLAPVPSADPRGALDRGEVDAAVVGWARADGLCDPFRAAEADRCWRFWVQGVGAEALEVRLDRAARVAALGWLEEQVTVAGKRPAAALLDATVEVVPMGSERRRVALGVDPVVRLAAAYVSIVVVFLLAGFGLAADRRGGVLESLLTTPSPTASVVWSRVLSTTVVVVALLALAAVELVVLLGTVHVSLLRESVAANLAVIVATAALLGALFLVPPIVSTSTKVVMNLGSILLTVAVVALMLGAVRWVPAWVPLAGIANAADVGILWLNAAVTASLTVALVHGLAAWLDRQGHRKLGEVGGR